jgi:hypothetical protein
MTQFRTIELPRSSYSSSRTPLRRYAPPAELLLQMLNQCQQPAQPPRAVEAIASDAYAYTAKATVIRIPAGYRRTVVV